MDCCVWCRRGSREPKQHGDDNLPYAAALLLPRSKSRAENHRPHGNLHSRNGVGSNLASTSRVSRQTSGTILVRLLGETSNQHRLHCTVAWVGVGSCSILVTGRIRRLHPLLTGAMLYPIGRITEKFEPPDNVAGETA